MQAVAFYLKRFLYFLGDTLFLPLRFARDLWRDPNRGRTLLFGLPSIIIFLVAATLALLAYGTRTGLQRRYQAAVDKAIEEKDRPAAITYTQKLSQLEPNNEKIKFELANLLDADDSPETGPKNRTQALALFNGLAPSDRAGLPEAHVRRAQQIWRNPSIEPREKIKLMEQHLNLALVGDSRNENARTMLAEIMLLQRKYEEALELFIDLFETNVALYRKIAEVYQLMGRGGEAAYYIRDAINRYDEFIVSQPNNVNYLRRRANAHALLGEFEQSIGQLTTALASETDDHRKEQLSKSLARIYISRSRTHLTPDFDNNAEARTAFLDDLVEAYQLDPTSQPAMTLITEFAQRGFPESNTARSVYDPRLDPENAPDSVLQMVGTHELINGDMAQGIALLDLGLQRNPRNHAIMNNLAYSLMDTDRERAFELADRAVNLNQNMPNYRDTRGNIYMRMGEYKNAIRDFELAVSLPNGMKDNVNVYRALVYCFEQEGMLEDAASYQKKVDELANQQSQQQREPPQ